MASLRTREQILLSGADAAGAATNSMVAALLKDSISSVPIPFVSGVAGWAAAECLKEIILRVDAAYNFQKDCRILADLLRGELLEEAIQKLDELADMPMQLTSRSTLIRLSEVISDANLLLCEVEAVSSTSGRFAKAMQKVRAMNRKSIRKRQQIYTDLNEAVCHERVLLQGTAGAVLRKAEAEDPSTSAKQVKWPSLEGPVFQHSSVLVPHIRRLLADNCDVGIVGMPGIGKTAIATAVCKLECSATKRFHVNVWLTIGPDRPDLSVLLKRTIHQLAKKTKSVPFQPDFVTVEGGLLQMKRHIKKIKVLFVLDDVRGRAGAKSCSIVKAFRSVIASSDSRLLVTTRQRSTLHQDDEEPDQPDREPDQPDHERMSLRQLEVLEVPCLSSQHALHLFDYHAFRRARNTKLSHQLQQRDLQNAQLLATQSSDLMAFDAKWSSKIAPLVHECGGNPGAVLYLARHFPFRNNDDTRTEMLEQLQQRTHDGKDDVTMECANVVHGLLPSERDCFIACAAYPQGSWVPEATLLHLFATHAPMHVPASVASAACKLATLVDCSLLCVSMCPASGCRRYSLHRILHRLALRLAHSPGSDEERKGTRAFHPQVQADSPDDDRVRHLSLHDGCCLVKTIQRFHRKNLQACIIKGVQSSSLPRNTRSVFSRREALVWPKKLQLLNLAFDGQGDAGQCDGTSLAIQGNLFLLNSLRLAGDMAPLLLHHLLPARHLLHIDLGGCVSLERLPECIGDCSQLLYLHLCGCTRLAGLPSQVRGCTVLADLNLSQCSALEDLPPSIKECTGLTRLCLRGCSKLTRLPDGVNSCSELVELDMQQCYASAALPCLIDQLSALTRLDLHGCYSLKSLPDSIEICANLQHLRLSECSSIEQLPAGLAQCEELVFLDTSGCTSLSLAGWPSRSRYTLKEPKELKKLEYLSLARVNIEEVPPFSMCLPRLARLDLSGCLHLKQLPRSKPAWPALAHLNLSDCSTKLQTTHGLAKIAGLGLTMMTHLDLSRCTVMTELKLSVDELSKLAHLSLRACAELTKLPAGLGRCSQLTHLDLSDCAKLQGLPTAPTIRRKLAVLNLSNCSQCCMERLQHYIGRALVHLELSGCRRLKSLPDCLGKCTQLTLLDLERCSKITELPETISTCARLAHLSLSRCSRLEGLQDSVAFCTFLTELNVSGCEKVTRLPDFIGNCLQLVRLDLNGCTGITSLPASINHCLRLHSLVLDSASAETLERCLPEFDMLPDPSGGSITARHKPVVSD